MTALPKYNGLGTLYHLVSRLVTLLPREINSTDLPVLADQLTCFIIESDYQGKSDMKYNENKIAGKVTASAGLELFRKKDKTLAESLQDTQKRKEVCCLMRLVFLYYITFDLQLGFRSY